MPRVDLGRVVETKVLIEILVKPAQEVGFNVPDKPEEKFDLDYVITPLGITTLKRNQRLELQIYDGNKRAFGYTTRNATLGVYGIENAKEFYITPSITLGIKQERIECFLNKVAESVVDYIFI